MRVFASKEENCSIGVFYPAISSINLTHRLICFFYLHGKSAVPGSHKATQATRIGLKSFCRLNDSTPVTFIRLNFLCMRYLFKKWQIMLRENSSEVYKKTTGEKGKIRPVILPNFQAAIDATLAVVDKVFSSEP
jgi:hypothetical protein